MPRHRSNDEPLEDWEEDADLDDDFDADYDSDVDDDDAEVVECPSCGEPVYEDAEQCPACGAYIVHSASPFASRQPWAVALFMAGVIAVIFACMVAF